MRAIAVCAAVIATAWSARIAGAQQTDIIRGRVTGPDSLPVAGVEVRATSYFGGIGKTASTDKNGRYTIVFINGEGDYWLDFRKLGFSPRRFEVKKIGDEEVLIADTRLMSTIATLDAVNVTSQRERVLPNRTANPDVAGAERLLSNTVAVSPAHAGDLAAMAAGVVGIQLIPGFDGAANMFSVLGLTGDQNNTLFNGLGSGISALPPDILAVTSIKPYSFDPAVGGFSGAQISIQTLPGSNFSQRWMSNATIAPPLEWTDTVAEAQGQRFTSVRVGGNAAGPIALNRMFYNGAYNVQRRFSDAHTLINANPYGLAAAGLAPDSAARLLGILPRVGVPLDASVPATQAQDLFQLATNVDLMPSASGTGHSFVLGGAGNVQRSRPVSRGGLLLTTPSHAGQSSFWGGNVALVHSNYFWFGILAKTTLGFGGSGSSSEPYVRLPEGIVRVTSTLPDGSSSVKPLFFGGSSALALESNRTIQLTNSSSWYSADNRHTIKVTASLARDAVRSDASPSLQGSFAFNSLADLDAGRASSFSRTLSANTRSAAQLTATASIGDYWRPTPNVQVQYGLRLDGNRFLAAPERNDALVEILGLRNDIVPNRAYLSPRVGLQWAFGEPTQIAYAPGAARPPRALIHAGVGIFQNMAAADLISPAMLATGLPSSSRSIACVGAAVPFPAWDDFLTDPASIPTRCADGSTGSVFASSSPNVTLFDARVRQPKSLRAAADWSGPVWDNRFVLGVQAIVSSGRNQLGAVDANLDPTERFSLAAEDGRPVFANPAAIVPATGSFAASASRRSAEFQRVTVERSDLRVSTRQVSLNVKPVTANRRLKWDLTYVLLDAQEKHNGFTSTVGNPFETFWSPRLQGGRHTIALAWSDVPVFDIVYLSAILRLFSGQRYTPMVGGDVNGDGYLNDRAFVFDPALVGDSATVRSMRALLASGTSTARRCLERQLDRLASRGSCIAPWTANAALGLKFNPQKIGLPKRLRVTLTVQNPLGIADLMLHGSGDVRGWGQNIPPDQNLLYVRGFDPVARQFTYDVNQRFGSTRPRESSTHALPFISLGFTLDVGMPRERQLLTQRLDLGRGKPGAKQDALNMKLLGTTTIPNPMNMILQQQDSLRLTRRQADSLASLSYAFSLFADSVWTPVSNELATLPSSYDHGDAYRRYVSARERTVDFLLRLVPVAKSVLTPSQRRRLPPQVANYLDERVLRFLRSSSSGDGTSVIR